MTIIDILKRNRQLYANDVGLEEIIITKEYKKRTMTWEEFEKRSNSFAKALINSGIVKGDKVVILLQNCLEWLPIYFGILEAGAIAVPLNYRFSPYEIHYCMNLVNAEAIVYTPKLMTDFNSEINYEDYEKIHVGIKLNSQRQIFLYEKFIKIKLDVNLEEIAENDFAAIYFSSGTTGYPKAVFHKHKCLMQSCIVEEKHHNIQKQDVFLCMPPLYHTGAKMHWLGSFYKGGKAVLLKTVNPKSILETISLEKCSVVWLLVPLVQDVLDAVEKQELNLNDYCLSQWRLMHMGAQSISPSMILQWRKLFPNQDYDISYGLTESTGPGAVHLGVENFNKIGSIGKAGFGWNTKIVDENIQEVSLGQPGELCLRGPGIMQCYYGDQVATEAALKDGWLLTGDIVKEDSEGFLYLLDRKKDVIIMGGENIYPVEIENTIRLYDKVKDVAVIGIPDRRYGEVPIAIIETKKDTICTEREIIRFCNSMAKYKIPRKVIFATVPRNPIGKIDKKILREKYKDTKIL